MHFTERHIRAGVVCALLSCAIGALFGAGHAIAGTMIFLSGHVDQVFTVDASFSPEDGILRLDPTGTTAGEIKVEIVVPSTRAPASEDFAATVLKRLTITKPTLLNVAQLTAGEGASRSPSSVESRPKLIRIRVLAP